MLKRSQIRCSMHLWKVVCGRPALAPSGCGCAMACNCCGCWPMYPKVGDITVELYGPPMSTYESCGCFSRKSIKFCSSFNKPRRSRGSRSAASSAESTTSTADVLLSFVFNNEGCEFALEGDVLLAGTVVPEAAGGVTEVAEGKIFTGGGVSFPFLESWDSADTTFPSSPFPSDSDVGSNDGVSILAVADVISETNTVFYKINCPVFASAIDSIRPAHTPLYASPLFEDSTTQKLLQNLAAQV